MFEIDYKRIKKENIGNIILPFVAGLGFFLMFGLLELRPIIKKISMDSEAKASYIEENSYIDSNGNRTYSPIYHFSANGGSYICGSSSFSSTPPNSTGTVYYKKKNPYDCITDYAAEVNKPALIISAILVFSSLAVGVSNIKSTRKAIKNAKYLATNGKLIKGIPYVLEDIPDATNLRRIAIDYKKDNGSIVRLMWKIYNHKTSDSDGLVDLLIDPNDPNNYYIDFDIKFSGNVCVENYNYTNQVVNNKVQTKNINAEQIANDIQRTKAPMVKSKLIIKKIILGIIIAILAAMILIDSAIVRQTIAAKNYINTTTYLSKKSENESTKFDDYIYIFEDKNGKQQEIIISISKNEKPKKNIKIKYDEKDPQRFYEEGQTYDKLGITWYIVKAVILILLLFLFFNKSLLNKTSILTH